MYGLGGVLLNRKEIIPVFVVILTILTVLISVGYSALNQNLSVSGEAFLRAKDNIRISRIELSDATNDGYETYNPEYSKRTTKMYTTLPKDDSSVTYTVKVTNSTGIRYKVGSIDVTSTNSKVSCTPSIEVDSILEDGITEFTVTANYENGMSQDTNLNACDIKYEFVPLDATPPTLAVQLVKDNGNTKTIKITAIDEVDGSGLSPDNIYKYYLSTSETELLGGIWKEYVNSAEFEISGDIEARYLWIYPVKDRAGNISGGNSSVEPYSVGKYIFIDDVPTLYNVIAKEALTDGVAKLYTGQHNDAYDESGTKKIFHFYVADDTAATSVLNKNNVLFAGFCWQMIRTTDTGGTKLIYNGVPKEVDGKKVCTNSGEEQQIGTSAFNENYVSPSYVGYMHNTVYSYKDKRITSTDVYKYANSFTYSNGTYKLSSDAVSIDVTNGTENTKLNDDHYTCFNTTGECNTIYYVYYLSLQASTYTMYIELKDGKSVEDALNEMLSADNVNQTNSAIKDVVDTWYTNNMSDYTKYLEDTVFCNDRSISDYGGWNPNGGNVLNYLYFKSSNYSSGDLYCTNVTDRFSQANDKAKLTYPVGLISTPEMYLLGNKIGKTGKWYWLASPGYFAEMFTYGRDLSSDGYVNSYHYIGGSGGVRPSVSLNSNTKYSSGTGSTTDPYIVDLNAPTVVQETIIDGDREKTVRITVSDDYGLSSENKYKYYLSTSETELVGGEWKDYTNGEIFTITGENETKYLWIYPVMDNAGNINDGKSDINTPYVLSTITFKDKTYLYDVLQKEAASGSGLAKLYTGQHNDTYNEIGTQNIYHFYGADDTAATSVLNKNNVLFAGFCWQMIRTTDTGGVKLIYNGTVKEEVEITPISESEYNVTSNDESYPYTYDSSANTWTSTMHTDSSSGTIIFKINKEGTYYLNYAVSSEKNYDKATFYKNGTQIGQYSGSATGTIKLEGLNTTDEIKVVYSKDVGASSGNDNVIFYVGKSNGKVKQICNNSGTEQQIGMSKFNPNDDSPAYVGYMYNTVYTYKVKIMSSSDVYKYAKSFTYSNGTYKLSSDAISIDVTNSTDTNLNNAHYTCFNTTGECSAIYYIFNLYSNAGVGAAYYIELKDGKSIENALNEMLSADNVNQTNSRIKDTVDTWYANNMTNYTKYLEDTVFCNDRSIADYGGWNSNGGSVSSYLQFKNFNITNNLYCTNVTDRFSVENEKARLTYPVGLMSTPEMYLLGNDNTRKTVQDSWLGSPYLFSSNDLYALVRVVFSDGRIGNTGVNNTIYWVVPAVSLAPGTQYTAGTGSTTDPYVIKTS